MMMMWAETNLENSAPTYDKNTRHTLIFSFIFLCPKFIEKIILT
jgi:hypothetical protein